MPTLIVTVSVFQLFTSEFSTRSLWFPHCSLNYSYGCKDFNLLIYFVSFHSIPCHYSSWLIHLFHFVLCFQDFISFHERKFFISSKKLKSSNFTEDQFGKVWSISLHFMSFPTIWLFFLCCRFFFFEHFISSISPPVFLTWFPDFWIPVNLILVIFLVLFTAPRLIPGDLVGVTAFSNLLF